MRSRRRLPLASRGSCSSHLRRERDAIEGDGGEIARRGQGDCYEMVVPVPVPYTDLSSPAAVACLRPPRPQLRSMRT